MSSPKKPWDKYRAPLEPEEKQEEPSEEGTALVHYEGEDSLQALPVVRHWLFAPNRTRQSVRHVELPGGEAITIGDDDAEENRGYGVLTVKHQRAIFALQQLWQQQGARTMGRGRDRVGLVTASSYALEMLLFGKHGGRQQKMVRKLLQELASIPVKFRVRVEEEADVFGEIRVTGLLQGAAVVGETDGSGRQLGLPWVEIRLGSWIIDAWATKDLKPLRLDTLDQLSSDLAKLLYPKLDWYLSTHARVELRLMGLVQKLGMTNRELQRRSRRRRAFTTVAKELSSAPLSSGYRLHVEVEPTADDEDDKLVASRVALLK